MSGESSGILPFLVLAALIVWGLIAMGGAAGV